MTKPSESVSQNQELRDREEVEAGEDLEGQGFVSNVKGKVICQETVLV